MGSESEDLGVAATPERIREIADALQLSPAAKARAFELSTRSPTQEQWQRFLSLASLLLGTLLIFAGILYFFAFNWAALPSFAKLGLLEVLVLVAALLSYKKGETPAGQAALLFAALVVGPLFGVYGQTYQTGADPFELFLAWAAVLVPWVFVGSSRLLWGLWFVLLDLSVLLFFSQSVSMETSEWLPLAVAPVNLVAWVGWEVQATREISWVRGRVFPRLFAAATLGTLLLPSSMLLIGDTGLTNRASTATLFTLLAAMGATLAVYLKDTKDLFMLAAVAGSVVTLVSCLCGRFLFRGTEGAFAWLAFGMLLLVQVSAATSWLRLLSKDRRTA